MRAAFSYYLLRFPTDEIYEEGRIMDSLEPSLRKEYSYRCSQKYSSSRVSRSEGEGEEWVRGFGGCSFYEIGSMGADF